MACPHVIVWNIFPPPLQEVTLTVAGFEPFPMSCSRDCPDIAPSEISCCVLRQQQISGQFIVRHCACPIQEQSLAPGDLL